MLPKGALEKFSSINLFERFKQISEVHQNENPFENYSDDIVNERFKSFGFDFKYDKKESFFGLHQEEDGYIFKLNLSLKYGIVETIMWAKDTVTGEEYGGVFSRLMKLIQKSNGVQDIKKVLYPRFSNYEELEEVVRKIITIYEDFKAVIKTTAN
jgi:hypothetical protein